MIAAIKSVVIAALFSAIAILLHSWNEPYGLFLALAVILVMMRYVSTISRRRIFPIVAAIIWVLVAWVASTSGNGAEILIEGDTIGSSFLIGASALVALSLIVPKKSIS